MILARLDLKAFGRFTDVSIDLSAGPRRFHLIYGPNESGKSTSLRAITSWLFGMPYAAEDCFYHSSVKLRVGGLLVDPSTGESLECIRRRGRRATLRDADDGEPIDEGKLEAMLGGISRETFLARFGLSYEGLVQGGQAILNGNGDLGQILFAAGAGVGRLREIQAELDNAAGQLFAPKSTKAVLNASLRKLEDDRKSLRDAQVPVAEFARLRGVVESKQREAASLDAALRQCTATLATLQAYQQALPLLPAWRDAREAFCKVADAPSLDRDFTERRRQISSEREIAASRLQGAEAHIAELSAKLESMGRDPVVMEHGEEIQAVFQDIATREKSVHERVVLLRSRRQYDRKIRDMLRQLSVEVDEGADEEPDTDSSEALSKLIDGLHVGDGLRARIHQLAASHAGLLNRRNECSEQVDSTKRRLADANHELELLEATGDPEMLAGVIESIGNPVADFESWTESRQSCETLRQRCEAMLQRLQGFDGDLSQAVRLAIPSDSSLQQLAESLRKALHDANHRESKVDELLQERETVQHQLLETQANRSLPTESELHEARRDRDRLADRLTDAARLKQDSAGIGEALREQIRRADQLADTMREHSELVHRRDALFRQIQLLDTRIHDAKSKAAAAHTEFESAKSEWSTVWQSCRVTAGQPEEMQSWLTSHGKLCDLMDQLETEERRLEQIQGRMELAARRLRNILDSVPAGHAVGTDAGASSEFAVEPWSGQELVSLYDEAVAIRVQWTRERQHVDAIRRRRDELAEELPQVQTRLDAARKGVEDWHGDWIRLTESFVKSDRVDTAEVLHRLEQIAELTSLKRERDSVADRLEAIEEDDQSFAHQVHCLAELVDYKSAGRQKTTAIAHALYQRLQAELTASRGRETLMEQIDSSKLKHAQAETQRNECDVVLSQFCAEAGCQSASDLPSVELRAKQRSDLQTRIVDLEAQLKRLAGQRPLEAFATEVAEQNPAELAVDIGSSELRQAELKRQIEIIHQEFGAAQNELKRIDGGSRASDLAQSLQITAGAVRSDVEDYARLKIGSLMLRRAIEHYRQQNQSPVLALANQSFRQLTCGEYDELKPDFDAAGASTLFGVTAAGDRVPVSGMSTGTADALYLALRLASLQHQLKDGRAVPVVIDDCLIQLDDARAAAALRAFSDLSARTQVILFTHHLHLCQLARQTLREDEYHLHQIGG